MRAPNPSPLSRRRFLRNLGTCLTLPALESALPVRASAAEAAIASPTRMAFVYFPNGVIQEEWWPKGSGRDFSFCSTLEPLEDMKRHVQVLRGLEHRNAEAGPDGAGDHARANGTFLTGVRVKKTAGADIHAGISVDQIAAQQLGHLTRFPSLELSCDFVRKSGSCDSGYSCAYEYNLAWKSPTSPLAPEPNPRLVFERLFGAGDPGERAESLALRRNRQRSILDFVLEDTRRLSREVTARDRQKIDEYLTGIREIEQRIEAAEAFGPAPDPSVPTPAGIPDDFQEHIRIMFSMLALAFETDSTRVATMLLAHDGSNRPFPQIGVPDGHHSISHHRNDPQMISRCARIDRFYVEQLAWFLQKLEATKDLDGSSLLHNSMVVYGCGNSDGNRHTHHNLPIVLAGGGSGRLDPGRYTDAGGIPMSNLYLSLLDRMGAPAIDRFGDSTGRFTAV